MHEISDQKKSSDQLIKTNLNSLNVFNKAKRKQNDNLSLVAGLMKRSSNKYQCLSEAGIVK